MRKKNLLRKRRKSQSINHLNTKLTTPVRSSEDVVLREEPKMGKRDLLYCCE